MRSSQIATVPESPGTLRIQIDQLKNGDRRAVMFPKGTPPLPSPKGMETYQDSAGNRYVFNPSLTDADEIEQAQSQNRLPELLGATSGGMGAPDKMDALKNGKKPVVVIARGPNGETAQSTLTDERSLPRTIKQTKKLIPRGGSLSTDSPENEIARRMEGPPPMPQFLEDKLRQEYGDNPHAIYGTMNKIGAMHGNKETAKGRAMEAKHNAKVRPMFVGGVVRPPFDPYDPDNPDAQMPPPPMPQESVDPTAPPPMPMPRPPEMLSRFDETGGDSGEPSDVPPPPPAVDQGGPPPPPDAMGRNPMYRRGLIQAQENQDQMAPPPMPGGRIQGSATQQAMDEAKRLAGKKPALWQNILGAALSISPTTRGIDVHPRLSAERQNLGLLEKRAADERALQQAQSTEDIKRDTLATNAEYRRTMAAQRRAGGPQTIADRIKEAQAAVDANGKPIFTPEEIKMIGAGWKPPAEKADKYVAVQPGNPILNQATGQLTPGMGEAKKTGGTGDFQAVFLPAYAGKKGKTVEQLTPEETMAAFTAYKQTNADPEMRESLLQSRALMNSLHQLTLNQQPTPDQAKDVAADLISHRMAPDQLGMLAGSFGTAGAAFKRMVYAEGKKLDPNFNYEEASATYNLVKGPGFQNTIRYMDSTRNSIPQVIQAAQVLANGKVKSINSLINMGKSQFNNIDLGKFNTDRLLVADEIGKILAGGGSGSVTSDAKLNQAMTLIKESDDPALVASNMAEVDKLLGFRRGALTKGTYLEVPSEQQHGGPTPTPGGGPARPTATDPKTGKKIQWNGTAWVPL